MEAQTINKSTIGLNADQLAHGTPSDKVIILKSYYKDSKATIAPAKDINGRYQGIIENIPEIKKLEMGYVPDINSRVKIYDGISIDLNDKTWAKDWEWMRHCREIADDFASGQATPGAYFYIFRAGLESAKKVSAMEKRVKLMNYILNDSNENLYNRASILGMNMDAEVISEVKEFLLGMVTTEPAKIAKVYESTTFSLELLYMHAIKKESIKLRNGVYTFGEFLLGTDKKAVISFFANPKNQSAVRAIEAMTYGAQPKASNPLADEAVSDTAEIPEPTVAMKKPVTPAAAATDISLEDFTFDETPSAPKESAADIFAASKEEATDTMIPNVPAKGRAKGKK